MASLFHLNFKDFLVDVPEAAFQSAVTPFLGTAAREQFFNRQFAPTHNRFLARLGDQIQAGQLPTARFPDFLEEIDFEQLFRSTPAALRPGGQFGELVPRTSFLF